MTSITKIEDTLSQEFILSYQDGDTIFSQNKPGKEMYIVYTGKVNLYRQLSPGRSKLLATMKAGDFFGEMALIDDSPRSATAIAGQDNTQLLVLDRSKFMYLLRNQPDFALVVMGNLCRHLRDTTSCQNGST